MLEKILYPLVVNGGIDTKTDKALVEAGKNLISENTALEEIGAINKRVGFTDLPDSIYGGGTLSSKGITSIFPHNNEIIAIGAAGTSEVYSFDSSSNLWHKRTADILSPMVFVDEDYTDSFLLNSIDSVEVPVLNYRFTVCVFNNAQSGGTFRSKLIVYRTDYSTGLKRIIYQEEKNSAAVDAPLYAKINALNTLTTNLWITYMDDDIGGAASWDFRVRTIDKDGTVIDNQAIETGITSLRSWDTVVYGSDLIITYQSAIAQIEFAQVSQAGAITSTANFGTAANIDQTRRSGISTAVYGTSLYVAYISNVASGVVRAFSIVLPFGAGLGEVVKDTFAGGVFAGKIAWHVEGQGANDKLILFYSTNISILPYHTSTGTVIEYRRSNTYFKRINPSDLSTVASDISSGPFQGVLASKPISTSNGIFILTQTLTPDSYSYHLCKLITDATIPTATDYQLELVGSFAVGTAYGDRLISADAYSGKNYNLSSIQVGESGELYCPLVVQERSVIQYISGVDAHIGVGVATGRLFKFDFSSEYSGIFSRIGENTTLSGAVIKEYDGLQLINSGFSDYPLISAIDENAVGNLAAGTYSYVCVFEFTDNNGQLWRSPVSAPLSITIVVNKSIDITFTDPTDLPIDFKSEAGVVASSIPVSQIKVVLYRTEKNGTVYRRLTSDGYANFQINGVLASPVNDNVPDDQIDGNELVYTDGGVLSNDIIPPFKYLLTAKNRQFSISSEDENLVYYSQPYLNGESVNWSQALTLRVDAGTLSNTGKAVALASMDDKIVVLKSSSIVAFVGDGPNPLGEDNNFTSPTLISANIGCVDPKSVVTIPSGVMFKSENGIYLLDRGLNATYIGADVEAYNSETIVAAQNIPKTNKVLLLTSSRSMVYDYMMGSWMTWTIGGQAACIWNSQITILKDGVVKYQSTGYKDGSSFYSMKLATPWLKISGVQEFQRIYKIIILGAYKSAHTLTAKVYFDYDETDFETHTISPLITDKVYQYEVAMTNQKCQSFKIEIYDNVNAGTGQGFKLSNITLQLGQKRGFNKLSATRKY